MSHLDDDQLHDWIDARLEASKHASVLEHLASCDRCRAATESQRLVKHRLAALTQPEPSDTLMARLLSLPETDAALNAGSALGAGAGARVVRPGTAAGSLGPGGSRRPTGAPSVEVGRARLTERPTGRRAGRLTRRPQRLRLASGAAASLGLVSAALFGLSVISPGANATVTPTMNMVTARHVITMSGLPIVNIGPTWRMVRDATGR